MKTTAPSVIHFTLVKGNLFCLKLFKNILWKIKKNGMEDTKTSRDVAAETFLKLTAFGDITC